MTDQDSDDGRRPPAEAENVPDVDRIQRSGEAALFATMILVYLHALDPVPLTLPHEFLYALCALVIALVGVRTVQKQAIREFTR